MNSDVHDDGYREYTPSTSVSRWIAGAREGDASAVRGLWNFYYHRLIELARQRLAGGPREVCDEEDIAISVFRRFCTAVEQGRFPDLEDRHDLWRLLVRMTANRVIDQRRYEFRRKRAGLASANRVLGSHADQLAEVIADVPSPEFAVMVAEELRHLLQRLKVPELQELAVAKMEGYTNEELATRFECSLRTIERRLRLIRKLIEQLNA